MKTYQDFIAVGGDEKNRAKFIMEAIANHKAGADYMIAKDAALYYRHMNPTIMNYQKFIFNQYGAKVPDVWSPNNKIASNWYNYFTTQAVSYLLGNGVSFADKATKARLGKDFDKKIQDAATAAKNGSVSFGFWNLDHLDVFSLEEFVPLYDEENGALRAGIRFWQIESTRPLRATLYEEDGYTDYIKQNDDPYPKILDEGGKRSYVEKIKTSKRFGTEIYDGRNYPSFPIIPLWNTDKVSDLEGNRGTIDAYDLIMSGLINNVNDGEFIYWILKNCNGMTEIDDVKFVEQLKLTHVAHAQNKEDGTGADVESHQATIPVEATTEALDRLKERLFYDFMALNVDDISANATNDQIQAAYEPLNQKTDRFEYQVTEFIQGILAVVGINDEPTYTRSQMSNRRETMDMVIAAAEYLDEEYVTEKILSLLGDADKLDEVMRRKTEDDAGRFVRTGTSTVDEEEEGADGV